MSYVLRDGRRIEIETLDVAVPRPPTKRFVKVPLGWAEAATKATNTQQAFVCILLLYAAWKAKGVPFAFTSTRLHRAKISLHVKRRTLDALENAGLIKIERHPGRSPIITLKEI